MSNFYSLINELCHWPVCSSLHCWHWRKLFSFVISASSISCLSWRTARTEFVQTCQTMLFESTVCFLQVKQQIYWRSLSNLKMFTPFHSNKAWTAFSEVLSFGSVSMIHLLSARGRYCHWKWLHLHMKTVLYCNKNHRVGNVKFRGKKNPTKSSLFQ